jgi:hypothetical protein
MDYTDFKNLKIKFNIALALVMLLLSLNFVLLYFNVSNTNEIIPDIANNLNTQVSNIEETSTNNLFVLVEPNCNNNVDKNCIGIYGKNLPKGVLIITVVSNTINGTKDVSTIYLPNCEWNNGEFK